MIYPMRNMLFRPWMLDFRICRSYTGYLNLLLFTLLQIKQIMHFFLLFFFFTNWKVCDNTASRKSTRTIFPIVFSHFFVSYFDNSWNISLLFYIYIYIYIYIYTVIYNCFLVIIFMVVSVISNVWCYYWNCLWAPWTRSM